MISNSEKDVLKRFRQYLMTPEVILCFAGPDLKRHKSALRSLTQKKLIVKEQFNGAYSLTQAGFEVMKSFEAPSRLGNRGARTRS